MAGSARRMNQPARTSYTPSSSTWWNKTASPKPATSIVGRLALYERAIEEPDGADFVEIGRTREHIYAKILPKARTFLKWMEFHDRDRIRQARNDLAYILGTTVKGLASLYNITVCVNCRQEGQGRRFMKPIPLNEETEPIARYVLWFEELSEALIDPIRFMAYAMRCATPEDMTTLCRYVSDDDFREAFDKAPPGIIGPRSWAYWNSVMGRYPAQPMPKRTFGE